MSNVVYKEEQIFSISKALNITKKDVKEVIDLYISGLIDKVTNGESIKFLNICYLVCGEDNNMYHETLAYISTEIGRKLGKSSNTVYRILSSYEELILEDIRKFYSYTIRGLLTIKLEEYKPYVYKLRLNKASYFKNRNIRIVGINSFKRKVEKA